jgi:hypothetical protein
MLKKIVAAAAVVSAMGLSAGAASATVCINAHANVNGTEHTVNQCV